MNLSDVLATELLNEREPAPGKARTRDSAGSVDALSENSLARIAERARAACGAQSSGISIFRKGEKVESKWLLTTGVMAQYEGSAFPLRHSVCGVAADLGCTQLFIKPHLYFRWIEHAGVYISEALVTPLRAADGRCFGTLWVMSHENSLPRFDRGDASELESLGNEAAAALIKRYPSAKSIL